MPLLDPLDLVGKTVSEKYDVERVVGEGGFAVVYRATHKVWRRPVALKVFRSMGDLPADRRRELVESFVREGTLLAELSERSAAICQARDVGTWTSPDGRELPYMVLEWLEGKTLEEVIDDETSRRMPPRTALEALALLEPAAEALALAHRKGIAHRDIKPANIFILGDPRGELTVKLLDFGIAKVVQDVQKAAGSFAQTQGVVSSFTPAYGAPEQFSRTHGATGPWTDVFALALIFTELLTQAPPLRGEDLTQLAFTAMDPSRRPTPRALGADVPDAVEAVILRALAVRPEDRYPSMAEFWDALRGALALGPHRAFAETAREAEPRGVAPSSHGTAPSSGAPDEARAAREGLTASREPHVADRVTTEGPRTSTMFLKAGLAAVGAAAVVVGLAYGIGLRGKASIEIAPLASPSASAAALAASGVVTSVSAVAAAACPGGMARIAGGKFFMGSDEKRDLPDERPAHQVTLSPFCIDLTEVSVAAYKACSDKGECKRAPAENEWEGITARDRKIYDPLCNIRDPDGRGAHPVNCIDWELATAFCAASGKRLPTEAEWEFATRGSDGRRYPWGDDAPTKEHLNACGKECLAWGRKNHEDVVAMYLTDDGFPTTAPVGSFPKGDSPFGLHDVVGNVWEWVSDGYAPYRPEAQTDPVGPSSPTAERVMRGGAWNGSDAAWVRPTYRFRGPPALRSHGVGFRCAKTLPSTL